MSPLRFCISFNKDSLQGANAPGYGTRDYSHWEQSTSRQSDENRCFKGVSQGFAAAGFSPASYERIIRLKPESTAGLIREDAAAPYNSPTVTP